MKPIPPDRKSRLLPGAGIVAFLLLPILARAELKSVFTVPPYKSHETAVGIEGWALLNQEPYPVYTDPGQALVIDSPVLNGTQPTTLELKTLLKNEAVGGLGDRFSVETQFALEFKPSASFDGGLYFRFGRADTFSPFHFGFYYGEGGGLYFQGQGDRVVVVPKEAIQQAVPYRFAVRVDRSTFTFRVTVTCAGDKTFRYESGEIAFQEWGKRAAPKFGEFFMGNNKPTTAKAYIDYVKITSLPE